MSRHLISPEFPPQLGGVGDYTLLMAAELAARGEEVHVWTRGNEADIDEDGFTVHHCFGDFGITGILRAGRRLRRFRAPRRLFLQWVPHGFGKRGLNVLFSIWIWWRARGHGDQLEVMFHEVRLAREGSLRQQVASRIQQLMVALIARSARKLWVSTSAWEPLLAHYHKPTEWLPVPANIPAVATPQQVAAVHDKYAPHGGALIGHFGTGEAGAMNLLGQTIAGIMDDEKRAALLLIGGASKHAEVFRSVLPQFRERVFATGVLPLGEVAAHLRACDLLLQPFVDGLSTRRTSAIAALACASAVVSTHGRATEPLWMESGAVALAPANRPEQVAQLALRLLQQPEELYRLRKAGGQLYRHRFDIARSADRLCGTVDNESVEKQACGC
jgi:glycosyltransferase involved in cell wall biosynthesis